MLNSFGGVMLNVYYVSGIKINRENILYYLLWQKKDKHKSYIFMLNPIS